MRTNLQSQRIPKKRSIKHWQCLTAAMPCSNPGRIAVKSAWPKAQSACCTSSVLECHSEHQLHHYPPMSESMQES